MRVLQWGFTWLCTTGAALASLSGQNTTSTAALPRSTACGDIIDRVNLGHFHSHAVRAHECLTSVPFNPSVALRFIEYFNTTMQFQSTMAYLRDPPAGYQQPAVDVEQVLQQIRANVTAGHYHNEYEFEAEVMALVMSMHDTHVSLYAGAMSAFAFGAYYSLVTASIDGVQPPKVYLLDDVKWRQKNDGANITAISTIDGRNAIEYLTHFAAVNSIGTVEPHASWNQLMHSPWLNILESSSLFFEGSTFYPGNNLRIVLENGSRIDDKWWSVYTVPYFTGPLSTGGDFYNFFVLGNRPANYDSVPLPSIFNLSSDGNLSPKPLRNWHDLTNSAYPNDPVVVQRNLQPGTFGGIVTGYILEDISTGVLSIPSFDQTDMEIKAFSTAVDHFIQNTTKRNISNIIIDLQGNKGGLVLLAYSTFGMFFPNIEPFAGSRRRSHDLANVIGNATTSYWQGLPASSVQQVELESNEWVVADRINAATGRNFSSWAEYYGPLFENGDYFSRVEQYDLTNIQSETAIFGGHMWKYLDGPNKTASPPFDASQIVLLTDGQCASTCAMFLEMMTHQAGVRTIAVGGEPKPGPMQAAGGTRGALQYNSLFLDEDIATANDITDNSTASHLPLLNPETLRRDSGLQVDYLGFNLQDQVRGNGSETVTALQFEFLPADCRIYYTLDTVIDMSALWRHAARATWNDSSLCVAGSTGNGTARPPAPKHTAAKMVFPSPWLDPSFAPSKGNLTYKPNFGGGISDGNRRYMPTGVQECRSQADCLYWYSCGKASYPCEEGGDLITRWICMPRCENVEQLCPLPGLTCDLTYDVPGEGRDISRRALPNAAVLGSNDTLQPRGAASTPRGLWATKLGLCKPKYGSMFDGLGCPVTDDSLAVSIIRPFSS